MRLTFFLFTDIRTGRGTENVALNLVKYKPRDIELTIVYTDGFDKLRLSEEYVMKITSNCKKIKIHTHNIFNQLRPNFFKRIYRDFIKRPVYKDLKAIKGSTVLAEIQQTDIVYLFHNKYAIFFNNANIPIIGTDHTDSISEIFKSPWIIKKLYIEFYLRNINGVHLLPKYKDLYNKFKLKYKMVLPNGVDCNLFFPRNPNIRKNVTEIKEEDSEINDRIKFLFVGGLVPQKGLDIILPLIEKIDLKNAEFHIVGSGPMEEIIKNNKKIIYHGNVDNEKLALIYRDCDVFLYPTRGDSFGLVILEALASGLYVITSDYMRGTFDDFEGKYLEYVPLDIEIIKTRVELIIKNRDLIYHDRMEEYKYVKEHYDWEVIANKFYSHMREFYNESLISK